MHSGDMAEGLFTIYGPENCPVEGRVSSTELRMEILTPSFSGAQDTVSWRFRAEGLSSGDVIKGFFRIISNRGEYMLPFVVTILQSRVESSMGDIRNIFHFANLARTDWFEAVRLFQSSDFDQILTGHDAAYLSVYRGLQGSKNPELALDEFLQAIHKKQACTYLPAITQIQTNAPETVVEETITLTRNGWGYTHLDIMADGAYLTPLKTSVGEVDFVGNTCRVRYRIDPAKLHAGHNFGSISFHSPYETIRIPFDVTVPVSRDSLEICLQKKRLTLELMKVYISFRMRKISSGRWLQEAGDITERMRALDGEDSVFALYQAHFMITASREQEGEMLLTQWKSAVMKRDTPDALRCYYLYLQTLISREDGDIAGVTRLIQSAFYGDPSDWRVAMLLQFVSAEYATDAYRKWELFKDQYARGCRSPIIYVEALILAAANPAILMRPDAFELAMIRMAIRENILPARLIERIVYLARHCKLYEDVIFKALCVCHVMREQDDTLMQICAMLIKGSRTDAGAYTWYEKGVLSGLRLTRLYEYYMASVTADRQGEPSGEIPRSVLMYFSHGSDLDYRSNALLYRYVYDHREEYPDIYEIYEERIKSFVTQQISKGRLNETLAHLYKNFLDEDCVNQTNAHTVLGVLYTSRIRIENQTITEVAVVYERLLTERHYPVVDGICTLPLYGSEYAIILIDSAGNRFAEGIPFDTDKLIIPGRLTGLTRPFIKDVPDYVDLFLCEMGGSAYTITMENVVCFRQLAVSEELQIGARYDIRQNLIRFYKDNDFTRQLTECLQEEDPFDLSVSRRNEILELMVLLGLHDRALKWIKRFGTYGVDPKVIMRMCAKMTDYTLYLDDVRAQEIIFDAFRRGRYDNIVLEFLIATFSGSIREMRDVWKAATSFGIDTYKLSVRLMKQMLYSGAYIGERMDVFKDYVQHGAEGEMEGAFLAQCAYDHFVRETVTVDLIYRRIGRMLASGGKLPVVCGMDYLKYFAGHRTGEFDKAVAEQILDELLEEDIYFPFFSEYADILPQAERFAERVILQYRTAPGKRCVIHFAPNADEADEEIRYVSKRMREMYDSVYVISFVLFFGEELPYYITESDDAEEETENQVLTESGTLSRSDIRQTGLEGGRFIMINDMCIAETLKDYTAFDRLIQDYHHTKYLTEYLFRNRKEE